MIYEFQCEKCNRIVERNYKMGNQPKKIKCGYCGANCYKKFTDINASIPNPVTEARKGRGHG